GQFGLKFGVLEEFAILGDPDRAILVADWLPPPGQVDDRQSPHPESDPRLDVRLLVVRSSMGDRAGHRQQTRRTELTPPAQIDRARDPAHLACTSLKAAPTNAAPPAQQSARRPLK